MTRNTAAETRLKPNPMRLFIRIILILLMAAGVAVLSVNGIYYWLSQPIVNTYTQARAALESGLPESAATADDRLAFYQDRTNELMGLPEKIDALNRQAWTFAVLIREDITGDVPALLDLAERGKTAVAAYFQALAVIEDDEAAFQNLPAEPADGALPAVLQTYADRLTAADHLETRYNDLATIPDIDLAGYQFSRDEIGVAAATASVSGYRAAVLRLQTLLGTSDILETRLDELYTLVPADVATTDSSADLAALRAELDQLSLQAGKITDDMPDKLASAYSQWQDGFALRIVFAGTLADWLDKNDLADQSLTSAATDRATARRYITDSLAEKNVETAYLWTKTAQQYQTSMQTAIDFTNIYTAQANDLLDSLQSSREAYRTALGLDPALQDHARRESVDPEAFWLAG